MWWFILTQLNAEVLRSSGCKCSRGSSFDRGAWTAAEGNASPQEHTVTSWAACLPWDVSPASSQGFVDRN